VTSPAVSPIPREARAYQGHRAGVITRVASAVLDGIVVAAFLLACYLGVNGFRFLLNPRSFSFSPISLAVALVLGFVVATLYLAAGWAINGQTYGSHVMGLRVVNYKGRRLRPVTSLLRAAFCVFFPIGLAWCAGSRANRSLQDVVLRTSVVYDWRPGTSWRQPNEE
jgi:uncharacterized RDD family membrane protein YckC